MTKVIEHVRNIRVLTLRVVGSGVVRARQEHEARALALDGRLPLGTRQATQGDVRQARAQQFS
jgi:hypothetical protein